MELRSLKYFVTIAELGNISGAAVKLGIAQPALTRQVKQLEEELGTTLLNRLARGVQLTASGREFLEYANRILAEVAQAKHEISGQGLKPAGSLVLGSSPTISTILMPKVVADSIHELPEIGLKLIEARSIRLHDLLLTGILDMAILTNPLPSYKLHLTPLISEPLSLIGIGNQLPKGRGTSLEILEKIPLILTPGMLFLVNRYQARNKLKLNVIAEIESIETIRSLVKAGEGMTIAPSTAFFNELNLRELEALTLDEDGLHRDLVLACRTDNAHLPAVRELSRVVRAAVNSQMSDWAINRT